MNCLKGLPISLLFIVLCPGESRKHYRGAVVEYPRVWDASVDTEHRIMQNVDRYVDIIRLAKEKNVDIIVFPEMGLMAGSTSAPVPVPDSKAKVTPWKDKSQPEVTILMQLLLCARSPKQLTTTGCYVVVNLLELSETSSKGRRIYNTNVAFDRSGTIIAKYRKYNLYGEPIVTKPDHPDHVYFDTDFGARFGLFTCFDILFEEPAQDLVKEYNVTDIAYPTAWFSELPFLSATQYQSAWSYGTGVNMLASGLNNVKGGSTGSGIYAGSAGPLEYILSEKDGCKLLYHDIPLRGIEEVDKEVGSQMDGGELNGGVCNMSNDGSLHFFNDNLTAYKTVVIQPPALGVLAFNLEEDLCQGGVCCNFRVKVEIKEADKDGDVYGYKMAVLDGVRDFHGHGTGGLQVCGILPCLEPGSCGFEAPVEAVFSGVSMKGTFQKEHSFPAPNVFFRSDTKGRFGKLPPAGSMEFTKSPKGDSNVLVELSLPGDFRIFTAAIYTRVYDRDAQAPSTTASFSISWSLILATAVSIFAGRIFYGQRQ